MTYNYSNAFSDLFKNSIDFNQWFSTQRRNLEAASTATQIAVEGAQAIFRRQAEGFRENVENVLRTSKEIMTSGTPETSISKQSELAKSTFENTLSNLREITETVTKSGFEAFDVINKRMAESLEELSAASGKATAAKKKAAA